MTPTVSVVLPVYNQAAYVSMALDSVFDQSYRDFEIIAVDDGSTDDTPIMLSRYQTRQGFIHIRQENAGLPRALNAGFAKARGSYLTWTSSDNIMHPEMLDTLVRALDRTSSLGLVYADRFFIDEEGNSLGRFDVPEYDPHLLLHVNLVHCCFLYRRACLDRIGGYDPEFVYGEDWEYWIRMSRYFEMMRVPHALYHYRLHRNSMTSELVKGTAKALGYREFARCIRRRMPVRWTIGKLKWWWLRLNEPEHPAVMAKSNWTRVAMQAAYRK